MADDDFQVSPTTAPTTAPTDATGGAQPAERAAKKAPAKKAAAKKAPAKKAAAKKAPAKKAAKKAAPAAEDGGAAQTADAPAAKATAKKASTKKSAAKKAAPDSTEGTAGDSGAGAPTGAAGTMLLFKAPEPTAAPARRGRKTAEPDTSMEARQPVAAPDADSDTGEKSSEKTGERSGQARKRPAKKTAAGTPRVAKETPTTDEPDDDDSEDGDEDGGPRRRRRRGGRRRRKSGEGGDAQDESGDEPSDERSDDDADQDDSGGEATSRRRRRRRRPGEDGGDGGDDPQNTVTRVRKQRSAEDEITAISGSTRLEAKKQRRRDGREAGRRRAPIVSEAEFLARRESVDRTMVIRQSKDLTQIGVLEDKVLVEHYVARESQTSLIGNVYLGRVQNVLPSMEAAFIDIGKGRNAVLYAGEVNWSSLGHREGQARKIESVLTSGQSILVQVTKDPIGHKGARLSSQVSLAGRFLVYVPDGTTSGISRKLPDTERSRLKALLKEIVPETAGVIVRTAAEGASEDELTRDVERLKARWEDIEAKLNGNSPQLLYGEPDLTLKVVRDLFTEDFKKLVIQGEDAWDTVTNYVSHVAPDLQDRVERYVPDNGKDIFASYRVDEQIAKGLDRKVWLPSGGSLVIDRTEALTVVDVNTGKFTGSGGNLEETVTKNNLEAAEEMVRQLRLRDIGGIIVIDFIDMVLESNRDLVLRRLVECLGRDRTRHQVAEVTSLGLVQMTRKRIGTGLVESFSEPCDKCQGRGVVIKDTPVEPRRSDDDGNRGGRRTRGGRGRGQGDDQPHDHQHDHQQGNGSAKSGPPTPKDVALMPRHEQAESEPQDEPAAENEAGPDAESQDHVEPAAPKVVTRSRRRGGARATAETASGETTDSVQADSVPAADVESEAVAPPEREPEADAPAEPATTEPAISGPPKVVTRTRTRSTSRRSTAPVVLEPAPMIVSSEPAPAEAATPVVAPEPPRVVTRTRGRSASRPAGPPAGGTDAESAAEGSVATVEHVPVKKKGSRKR
ncbi:Rne/Rng family ribonuclease [Nocardioides sp.]|uniref:Rne/Rng family ribonuclease n=1 Tax=Nocardioides sp. TaxID=35761 RepID=UPI0031FEF9E8|nr:RNAse [Nocardioides sp.]